MNKKFTVAILGVGSRGFTYGGLMQKHENFDVVSICDCNPAQLDKANKLFNLPEENVFVDEEVFLQEKRADVMVIATPDKLHVRQCVRAMELGYDVMMEKPVSDSEEEVEALLKTQQKTGKKVVVCHVLRYSAPFKKVEQLLRDGAIGKLIAIDAIERVMYWHQAQAYVRIQSEVNDIAHPTILAKCCHDLDYIQHYAQSKCDTVSSIGGLSFFRAENTPEGAADRCLDCKYVDTCEFSAKKVYIDSWHQYGRPTFSWPYNKVSLVNPTTEADLYEGIKNTLYGKCVFKCGIENNKHVVDHQMVQMHFENGVDATLKMLFTPLPGGRRIYLFGTKGELFINEDIHTVEYRKFGLDEEDVEVFTMNDLLGADSGYGHGGGDMGLVRDLYSILIGEKQDYTSLAESVESHLIGIKAEVSRLNGGVTLKVHKNECEA